MAEAAPGQKRTKGNKSSKQTRAAILEAAASLFARKGFKATTISDIAILANVNRALISYHFGGKGALYGELLDSAVAGAAKAVEGVSFNAGAPDAERRLIRVFADVYSERPHLAPMLVREHLDPDFLLDIAGASKLRGFMNLTEKMLQEAELRPAARTYDPQIVHLICVGSLIYFLITQAYRERIHSQLRPPISAPSLDEFVETLSDMLGRALRTD